VKKILKTSFFVFSFLALFYSNAFAFLEFKQEKDISTDTKAVNGFDLKMSSNYNFLSDVPDYGANIEISNKFEFNSYSITSISLMMLTIFLPLRTAFTLAHS